MPDISSVSFLCLACRYKYGCKFVVLFTDIYYGAISLLANTRVLAGTATYDYYFFWKSLSSHVTGTSEYLGPSASVWCVVCNTKPMHIRSLFVSMIYMAFKLILIVDTKPAFSIHTRPQA